MRKPMQMLRTWRRIESESIQIGQNPYEKQCTRCQQIVSGKTLDDLHEAIIAHVYSHECDRRVEAQRHCEEHTTAFPN